MRSFKMSVVVAVLGGVLFASADQARAQSYRDVVLADNPAVYYEFNEAVGATQALDSSGSLNTDGSVRHTQFVGQRRSDERNRARADDFGFDLIPGANVFFGGRGPVGTTVEFNDPTPAFSSNDQGNPNPGAEGYGGYIETGLYKNFGPNGGNYTIQFLYRDNEILAGLNRTESLVGQIRYDGPSDLVNPPVTPASAPGVELTDLWLVGQGPIDFDPFDAVPGVSNASSGLSIGIAANNAAGNAPNVGQFSGNVSGGRTHSGFVPAQGKWQQVIQTFEQGGGDSGRGLIRWYVDGVLTGSNEIVGDTGDIFTSKYWDNDLPLVLGASVGSSPFHSRFFYDGFLDEFAVYDFRLDDPNGDGDESDSRIAVHADAFADALDDFNVADFDFDNDVDGADFLAWQRAIGTGPPIVDVDGFVNLVEIQESAGGDANGDDLTDGADLAIWEGQFGATGALSAATGVPEPSTGLLAGGLLALAALARRRSDTSC